MGGAATVPVLKLQDIVEVLIVVLYMYSGETVNRVNTQYLASYASLFVHVGHSRGTRSHSLNTVDEKLSASPPVHNFLYVFSV